MEAFDQPWKTRYEGAVGSYWGIYDVHRQAKFAFVEPIVRIPQWQTLAWISVAIATVIFGLLYVHSLSLGTRGRSLLAVVVYAAATTMVWIIYDYSRRYLTMTSVLIGTLLIMGMLGVIAVLLAEALEWAEARWGKPRKRPFVAPSISASVLPKVSIHVPAYNEPPDMLIETLDALARLDYPNYEVIVVDNNTPQPSVWQPVEQHCRLLGERFRFFHVAPLAGFKAGALNFALSHTAADASIVAVIDSDYKVEPHWLRTLVPTFADEKIAIVQSPQDYRDAEENAFKAMCYAEYRGFFHIGMVVRNERNAIIQHGTMTLVRRSALTSVGGWAEWCITEDAELGLRLFEHGHEAQYLPVTFGRGLMPETFTDYKKQRFRWAYGAVQILRAHAGILLSSDERLTKGQRYHFIAGWLPWLADGLNIIFNSVALGSAAHDVLGAAADAVRLQDGEARASVFFARRSKHPPDIRSRAGRPGFVTCGECRGDQRPPDSQPAFLSHAEGQAAARIGRGLRCRTRGDRMAAGPGTGGRRPDPPVHRRARPCARHS
jgi:hypothetical protein